MHGMSDCHCDTVLSSTKFTQELQLNHKKLHKLFHNVLGNFIVLCWAVFIDVFDYVARGLGLRLVVLMLGSELCFSD